MVTPPRDKRASPRDALFVLPSFPTLGPALGLALSLALLTTHADATRPASTTDCSAQRIDIHARVDRIYDGDTLRLADGRKVRLIGINTPERAREDRPSEPLADAATRHLENLTRDTPRLHLQLGADKRDRYGRLLAHVYLADGRNLTQLLLEQGYGLAILVPPNAKLAGCYQKAEQQARRAQRGVWRHAYFSPLAAEQVAAQNITGFRRLQGRIVRVSESRKSLWLNLSDNVALRISRTDLHQFEASSLRALAGKQLVARGWIRAYQGRWQMQIRHPAALEIAPRDRQ